MRKGQLVSIGRFAAKLAGSCLILGLGAILLDPGMLAVFRKAPDVSGGTVKRSLLLQNIPGILIPVSIGWKLRNPAFITVRSFSTVR